MNSNTRNRFVNWGNTYYYVDDAGNVSNSNVHRSGNIDSSNAGTEARGTQAQNIKDLTDANFKDKIFSVTSMNFKGAAGGAIIGGIMALITKRSLIGMAVVGTILGVVSANLYKKYKPVK